ncbi:hypothetical protein UPYG_G00247270 [Umbra pygmaea]|uniref:LRRCT domain-containing protein n=1 Tax=Umbra pygmaea TaxID=75934 RepID=A0ABD0X0P3_UMBPY
MGLSDIPASINNSYKVLIFPQNLFSSLVWSSYSRFKEVYEVDLSYNMIKEVPLSPILVLPTLGVLRLVGNHIGTLPPYSFNATPGLLELYLEKNNLQTLDDLSFSGLTLLQILDLSQNRISVLPPLMFNSLPAIETLILEVNNIKIMPKNWFSAKPDVPYTFLSQNLWTCSCEVDYLKQHLEDWGNNVYVRDGIVITVNEESVTCATPPELANRPIISLEKDDYCSEDGPQMGPAGDSQLQTPIHTTHTTPASSLLASMPATHSITTTSTTVKATATSTSAPTTAALSAEHTYTSPHTQKSLEPTDPQTPPNPPSLPHSPYPQTGEIVSWSSPTWGVCVCERVVAVEGSHTLQDAASPADGGGGGPADPGQTPEHGSLRGSGGGKSRVSLCSVHLQRGGEGGCTDGLFNYWGGRGGGAAPEAETGGNEGGLTVEMERAGQGVYRKSLVRMYSREGATESWREERGRGLSEGGAGPRSTGEAKKRYSLVLREEAEAGREVEKEWVVGGWAISGGEEGTGAGDWWSLLPSMPWCNPPNSDHTT